MTDFAPSERQTDEKSIVCVQLGLRLGQEESLGHVYLFAHHLMSLSTLSRTIFFLVLIIKIMDHDWRSFETFF